MGLNQLRPHKLLILTQPSYSSTAILHQIFSHLSIISILPSLIFAIAITVLMLIADVPFMIALTDAIVEPIANSVWYFILDKWWASKVKTK